MSQQNDDFISFEKALRDLRMHSEELKKLVSEGDIRAFRDGDSMKFRREDLESLRKDRGGETELVFAETLEDDTGMVTEELSADDTLLADDGDDDDDNVATVTSSPRATATRSRASVVEEAAEPMWIGAVAVLSFALLLYGFMVAYKIAMETPPSGLTGMWAPK